MAVLQWTRPDAPVSTDSGELRPIITSLNGDDSWLLSFPRPASERAETGKAFYHVVSDPFLNGPAILYSSWLLHLDLQTPPAVCDGDGVAALISQIEERVRSGNAGHSAKVDDFPSGVDAICIQQSGPDHLHKPALSTFPSDIPIFAIPEAVPTLRSWGHFETVVTLLQPNASTSDWRSYHPGAPLPPWLSVIPMTPQRQNFSWAIVYTGSADARPESIVSCPHGTSVSHPAANILPDVSTLALLSPLKDSYTYGFQAQFGIEWGLKVQQQLNAKYWASTHDARFKYFGLLALQITDVFHALEEVSQLKIDTDKVRPNAVDVGNGRAFTLL